LSTGGRVYGAAITPIRAAPAPHSWHHPAADSSSHRPHDSLAKSHVLAAVAADISHCRVITHQ
jgi:hypothetical protein